MFEIQDHKNKESKRLREKQEKQEYITKEMESYENSQKIEQMN